MSTVGEVPDNRSTGRLPGELVQLFEAADPRAREAAWSRLMASYSRLLLHFARSLGGDHDAAMDRYAYMLDRLSQDDFRRLRSYRSDNRAAFSTWLATVARRLCVDHHRMRYGRTRPDVGRKATEDLARRRLLAGLDQPHTTGERTELADPNAVDPSSEVCAAEVRTAVLQAVRNLEPIEQRLLAYWFDEGLSAAEIAHRLSYNSPLQVYRQVQRACCRVRRQLEARGIREALP
jgi:RNA polymerase sigma factor (sigma-70 family)